MDIFIGPITELIKCLIPPVLRHICYVVVPSSYVEKLKMPMEKLKAKRSAIQWSVDTARGRGEVIKKEVEDWLARVDDLQTEETLLHDAVQDNKGCLQGGCSLRYHVGKKADEKIILIYELQSEGQFAAVSDPAPPPGIESTPTLDFEPFQSTKLAMQEIMRALQDENINLVGVYGMGGVGKTTLVKELGKGVAKVGLFDQVVMVTVTQDPIIKKIQGEIADNLGIKLEEQSESVRGRRLLERLKQDKRTLIILDDLWAPLELAAIGITFGDDSNRLCKVLLTTRSRDVCSPMRTQAEIEVSVLTEQEAWSLFQKNAGECVASDHELHTTAVKIAKKCGGLPIALVTLGRALRNKDSTVWADAARQLKRSVALDVTGMNAKVYSSIKLSYDVLERKETKYCFLLCTLFPEATEISEDALFPYVIGERVFREVEFGSLMEARDRLHAVLDKLQALCLLLKAGNGSVRMHDVVRDVAIEIAREDHGFQVEAGRGLKQWQYMENPERCMRLSLMQNEITKLPNRSDCIELVTLSLRNNKHLEEISDRFFEGMTSLSTLDLSMTSICSLPSSISCLTNLRVLILARFTHPVRGSQPLDVSLLGNLKKLEILDLENCNIWCLPEEIGGLTKLKSLNLSGNKRLMIPSNVVSKWSRMEELDMYESFDKWHIEELTGDRSKAYFSDLGSLTGLTNLRLHISNGKCLSACVQIDWENMRRFSITIGNVWENFEFDPNYDAVMYFIRIVVPKEVSDWLKTLMGRTKMVCFSECNGLKNVLQVVKNFDGLKNLKVLHFENCNDVEYLLNAEVEKPPEIAFNSLEALELSSLNNLKEISVGPLPNGCFNKLRKLQLWHLPKLETIWKGVIPYGSLQNIEWIKAFDLQRLKYLFSATMVERIHQLERLQIEWCDEMVQIISIDEEEEEWEGPIGNCRSNFPNGLSIPIFHNLRDLCIVRCPKLKNFLPLSLSRGLLQLEEIEISLCDDMEEIFAVYATNGEINEEDEMMMKLPKLKILKLFGLPKLLGVVTFSSQGHLDLPSLTALQIYECPNLKSLPLDPRNPPPTDIAGDWIGLEEIKKNQW